MENKIGDKSIKKETKKKKKSDIKPSATLVSSALRPVATQPELIKKVKKHK